MRDDCLEKRPLYAPPHILRYYELLVFLSKHHSNINLATPSTGFEQFGLYCGSHMKAAFYKNMAFYCSLELPQNIYIRKQKQIWFKFYL